MSGPESEETGRTRAPRTALPVPRSGLRDRALRYGWATVAGGTALLLWNAFGQQSGRAGWVLFLAATTIAAYRGFIGPGILAALIGTCCLVTSGYARTAGFGGADLIQAGWLFLVALIIGAGRGWLSGRTADQGEARGPAATVDPDEAMCVLDRRGRVFSFNGAGERLLGWSESELRGKAFHRLIHSCGETGSRERSAAGCPLDRRWRSGLPHTSDDDVFVRRDGTTISVSCSISPIHGARGIAGAMLTFRDITAQKQRIAALHESTMRYARLIETSPDSIIVTDIYGYVMMANDRAAELYGFGSAQQMTGTHAMELFTPDDRVRATQDRHRVLDGGSLREVNYAGRRCDETVFPAEVSTSLVLDGQDKPDALVMVTRDRTEQKELERSIRQTEKYAALHYAATAVLAESRSFGDAIPQLLRTVCQGAGWQVGAFWSVGQLDDALRCQFLWHRPDIEVPHFETVTRQISCVPGSDLPGRAWQTGKELWVPDVLSDPTFTRALAATKEGLRGALCIPVRLDRKVQAVIELFSRDVRPPDAEMLTMMETLSVQVAQFIRRRQAEEALEHAAYHDPLTNLANRSLFKGRMDRTIISAWPDNLVFAILLMDLDRFKEINDAYGHQCGDAVLQRTATRIRHALRDSDTVARLGGDEFAVLLPGTDEQGARVVAAKLVDALTEPIAVSNVTLQIGTSIGIALYPEHGENTDTLLHHADVAMYFAKSGGSGNCVYREQQKIEFQNRRRA